MQPLPRVDLIQRPTPLHRLPRLSDDIQIDLWIKRDDLTGFAFGGNKGRKLEFIMAEALSQGAEVVTSCGASQSNFVRQLAGACSVLGIKCAAAVMDLPYDGPAGLPSVPPLRREAGNVSLDRLLGADLRFHPNGTWEELYEHTEQLAQEYEGKHRRVYRVPVGGSSPLGAYAFFEAGREVAAGPFDSIVLASSSGSTHTGLAHAFQGTPTRVVGIACDYEPEITADFAELSAGLCEIIGGQPLRPQDFELHLDYVGPGYGVPSAAGAEAAQLLARREGIFLDPVYTAKAFAGLLDLAGRGELGSRVLFWHTGGLPALFAAPEEHP